MDQALGHPAARFQQAVSPSPRAPRRNLDQLLGTARATYWPYAQSHSTHFYLRLCSKYKSCCTVCHTKSDFEQLGAGHALLLFFEPLLLALFPATPSCRCAALLCLPLLLCCLDFLLWCALLPCCCFCSNLSRAAWNSSSVGAAAFTSSSSASESE